MPNRFTIFIIALFTIIISSCDFNKEEKAMMRSTEIAAINDTLAEYGQLWGDELRIAVNTLDFSNMKTVRGKMEDYLKEKIAFINTLEPVGGSQDLQGAEKEFLEFELKMVENHFVVFESFNENTRQEDLENAYMQIMQYNQEEQKMLKNLYELREQYADKNGIPKPIE